MSKLSQLKNLLKPMAFIALFCALCLSIPSDALAQSLDDLRANGQVGEAFDGYARARDASQQAFVNGVNEKRRAIYSERAQEQGISAAQVGQIYAGKIIAKSPSGTWLLSADGSWRQK